MRFSELAAALGAVPAEGAADITGLTADSREVRPGFLFAALKGTANDGAAFMPAAIAAGAAAILTDRSTAVPSGIPVIRSDDPRLGLGRLAATFTPGQPAQLVAVTGTSGKTSVADFTRQIFTSAKKRAASIGTLGVVTAEGRRYGSLTTPDPVRLHAMLDELAREGVTHAAIEASSHGLDQRRLDALRLTAAGFTNLGRDHMDYHPTVEHYLAAKLRLFEVVLPKDKTAVVDVDSEAGEAVAAAARRAGRRVWTVGRKGRDIRIISSEPRGTGQWLDLMVLGRRAEVRLPLAGTFQASNAVMAMGLALAAGIAPMDVVSAVAGLKGAPGRLEKVGQTADGAAVFVDYAHKPEALRAALGALRPMTSGRLIVVFGAGGDRDPGKRPLMGQAATESADIVIVTDDNPRSEEPAAIRAAILDGAPGATEIAGRGEAIAAAVRMLGPGDVLCVAGKGHETGQIIKGKVLPFSDHEAVAEALRAGAA